MLEPCGILTLTTDFGTRDGYVGAVKGRILSIAPDVQIVDMTHDIPPHDINFAAQTLTESAIYFPTGTVHLAVVDPSVGSSRATLVIRTRKYWLVGPDNGLLSLLAEKEDVQQVIEVIPARLSLYNSPTFDALTCFAPVAAQIINGVSLENIGEELEEFTHLSTQVPEVESTKIKGEVVKIDQFGNCISNITRKHLGKQLIDRVWFHDVEAIFCHSYYDLTGTMDTGVFFNEAGYLECAMFCQSLQKYHQLEVGNAVTIQFKVL